MSTLLLLYCTDEDNTKSSQCLNSAWEAQNTCWQETRYHRCKSHGPARSPSPQEAREIWEFYRNVSNPKVNTHLHTSDYTRHTGKYSKGKNKHPSNKTQKLVSIIFWYKMKSEQAKSSFCSTHGCLSTTFNSLPLLPPSNSLHTLFFS